MHLKSNFKYLSVEFRRENKQTKNAAICRRDLFLYRGGIKIENRENLGQCPNRGGGGGEKNKKIPKFNLGERGVHHVDPPRSIAWIHQDPSLGSTRIHLMDPPGSITWIHQDPSCGSTRIHRVDPTGAIAGIQQEPSMDPTGSITWIHQDPSHGSTRICHVDK